MSAHTLRREADLARLRELSAASAGKLELLEATPRPGKPIRVAVHCRTAASSAYPQLIQQGVTMRIDLPARYPFERPVVTVESRIFHPNIFASGVICQGEKWLPGEGLDLLVKRVMRLITFDPGHVNPASAANRAAAAWYLQQRVRTPEAFPTDRLDFLQTPPAGAARSEAQRVVRSCPVCGKGLRLPAGRSGTVACPGCGHEFQVAT
jgi:ubiquitin-protein ligase